jgi:hypothetical protein
VYRVFKGYATDAVGQYIACVTVHDAVDVWETLVNLTVDVTLDVAGLRVFLDRFGGFDMIFDKVVRRAHQGRRHITGHPESCGIVWRAHRDVTVRVKDLMAMEYVGGSNEALEEVLKSNLLTFGEVSCRHVVDDERQKASRTTLRDGCGFLLRWMYDDVGALRVGGTSGVDWSLMPRISPGLCTVIASNTIAANVLSIPSLSMICSCVNHCL